MPKTERALRAMVARRLLTSSGARANAAQGLHEVRRDREHRAAADAAVCAAESGAPAGLPRTT